MSEFTDRENLIFKAYAFWKANPQMWQTPSGDVLIMWDAGKMPITTSDDFEKILKEQAE